MENKENIPKMYTHRFLARIILEAKTPIAIGTGIKIVVADQMMIRDVNGLPFIPGTSLAGIIRQTLDQELANRIFGCPSDKNNNTGTGSFIIFTSAQMVGRNGFVADGLSPDFYEEDRLFFDRYKILPIRQHVSLDHKGTSVSNALFSEEVVYKGSRFCFEMEMLSDGKQEDECAFDQILDQLSSDVIRVGGGTRCGLGEIAVVKRQKVVLDLTMATDRNIYIEKTSDLNNTGWWKALYERYPEIMPKEIKHPDWCNYELQLTPDDFFLFGSGLGSDEASITPVIETFVQWTKDIPLFIDKSVLIPGSSVKGALSHRIAFHYNKLRGRFANNLLKEDFATITGSKNEAVRMIFGYAENSEDIQRGNILISDIIESNETTSKLLNHVSIDRFTGGAIAGALFSEEVMYKSRAPYTLTIRVNRKAFSDKYVKEAFESALNDLITGMLPLGGGVNRGHGCFTGTIEKK